MSDEQEKRDLVHLTSRELFHGSKDLARRGLDRVKDLQKRKVIFIVDLFDDTELVLQIKPSLDSRGYEVYRKTNHNEAVEFLSQIKPDMVICQPPQLATNNKELLKSLLLKEPKPWLLLWSAAMDYLFIKHKFIQPCIQGYDKSRITLIETPISLAKLEEIITGRLGKAIHE